MLVTILDVKRRRFCRRRAATDGGVYYIRGWCRSSQECKDEQLPDHAALQDLAPSIVPNSQKKKLDEGG